MAEPAIELQHGRGRVLVCPEIGGAIARFRWGGRDILRPVSDAAIAAGEVRQMGVFPLAPYSNRVARAQLLANGQAFALRPNFPGEPHSLHGFGWQRPWRVAAQTEQRVVLALEHQPDDDWPFACRLVQRIVLEDRILRLQLTLTNTDSRPMPAGLGFHPFFPIDDALHLQTGWQGMWQMGEDRLPTEHTAVPPRADFSSPRPVRGWVVDHCFTGWNRSAALQYARHTVLIEAGESAPNIVCFVPGDGRPFIALEPVSNINNAHALAARGVPDTGLQILQPGASFEIAMSLSVEGNPAG